MRKMISDIVIAFFIWTMLYFMFKPGQDIMKRAALENFYVLEFLIISGFIVTIIVDFIIRKRINNKNKKNYDKNI